jgi:hypothetical protein
MSGDARITLILDPFAIYAAAGQRIGSFADELSAFAEIDKRLKMPTGDDTIMPLTLVINGPWIPHFRAYRNVRGVRVEDLTPTKRVKEAIGLDLPGWLTDDLIHGWGLLRLKVPSDGYRGSWEATIASWLFPDVDRATTIHDWLRLLSQGVPNVNFNSCQLVQRYFLEQLARLGTSVMNSEEVAELCDEFSRSDSPVAFSKTWMKHVALLPISDVSIHNPLQNLNIESLSPKQRVLARKLPLVYPLPAAMSAEVSQLLTQALQKARLKDGHSFEKAILKLNALWDGIGEEIEKWLIIFPNAMTQRAAEHLESLPGYSADSRFHEIVQEFRPAMPIPEWAGCDTNFDEWVTMYARWSRQTFIRRDFPVANCDPSNGFSKWLKANYTVSFAHPERSYLTVSGVVRSALNEGRIVLIVIIDALAIHVLDNMRGPFSQTLGKEPTKTVFVFSPIPTVTEVCKNAILTGRFPDQSSGNLKHDLMTSYALGPDQVVVPANWNDANRLAITPQLRLIAYRDNRLDDHLATESNYRDLLGEVSGLAAKVSALLRRLVDDICLIHGSVPLVLLTADHGFTYGPSGDLPVGDAADRDRSHRCVGVDSPPDQADPRGQSMTFIDKDMFHNKKHYLAIRERRINSGTLSGWKMSHGGLLPEEVIIPLVEWFGAEAAITWPKVEPVGDTYRERGAWRFNLRLTNPHGKSIPDGTIIFRTAGQAHAVKRDFGKLMPGQQVTFQISLLADIVSETSDLIVETNMELRSADRAIHAVDQTHTIRKARQLAERTTEQDSFENMF